MPPAGGFEGIKYRRNLAGTRISALTILGAVAVISGFGFYRYGQGILERR
jgi:NADH dehydrogenase (ubiquinone) 1 alpha subcomplex subunit 13